MSSPIKKESIFTSISISKEVQQGSPILFPTDTVIALAASPLHASKLWELKKRSLKKPLILMGANFEELFEQVLPIALEDASSIADRYWPGALTMVLPASGSLVSYLNSKDNTIGLRVPGSSYSRELLSITGPLATTSANISGCKPAMTIEDAAKFFPEVPLLGPLPWPVQSGLASTVISWEGKSNWKLLRSGEIIPDIEFI
tara:strand:- start:268 stop:873 length:606 start_codon:yes stop_codon:yes gene_type:complete